MHKMFKLPKGQINISILFLLLYMSLSSWQVFLNLYLEGKGFTGSEIGIVNGILQGTMFFVVPIWGIWGDKFGINKTLRVAIVVTAILLSFFQYLESFITVILYMLPLTFFLHPLGPLQDSMAVNFVKTMKTSSFGELRVWGSVGWGLVSLTMGYFITDENIDSIFVVAPIILLLMLFFINSKTEPKTVKSNTESKLKQFKILLKNRSLLYFFIIIFLYGFSLAPIGLFINLYFKEIGANYQQIGLAFAIQCLAEIPLFFIGIRIVKRIGAPASIIISAAITLLRLILYSLILDPVIAIIVGLGQGFTLSLFLVASVEYVHNLVPENLRATGQSLIWAFQFGAGVTVGNLIIGYLYELVGMQTVIAYDIVPMFIIVLLLLLYFKGVIKNNHA